MCTLLQPGPKDNGNCTARRPHYSTSSSFLVAAQSCFLLAVRKNKERIKSNLRIPSVMLGLVT